MRISTVFVAFVMAPFARPALAAVSVPLPGMGIEGPAALIAAIGAVVVVKYLHKRKEK